MSGLPLVALLTQDAPGILGAFGSIPQWGIFGQDGEPILVSDAVGSVEYEREYDVSNYPQEQGAFESYNKVQVPYSARVTLLSSLTRQELLATIEPVVASLQLVTVVMPEMSYQSANLVRYGFRRTSRSGATMISVDVWCKEIRFSTTSNLSSSGTQAVGGQQSQVSAGTPRPIGQVSNPIISEEIIDPTGEGNTTLDTGSTNAATPTQSGPVQPLNPLDTIGAGGALPFLIPE